MAADADVCSDPLCEVPTKPRRVIQGVRLMSAASALWCAGTIWLIWLAHRTLATPEDSDSRAGGFLMVIILAMVVMAAGCCFLWLLAALTLRSGQLSAKSMSVAAAVLTGVPAGLLVLSCLHGYWIFLALAVGAVEALGLLGATSAGSTETLSYLHALRERENSHRDHHPSPNPPGTLS